MQSWRRRSSAPAPPQGAPGGSGQPGTPRKRPDHWVPSHCLGCSSQPPPKPPISPPLTLQAAKEATVPLPGRHEDWRRPHPHTTPARLSLHARQAPPLTLTLILTLSPARTLALAPTLTLTLTLPLALTRTRTRTLLHARQAAFLLPNALGWRVLPQAERLQPAAHLRNVGAAVLLRAESKTTWRMKYVL